MSAYSLRTIEEAMDMDRLSSVNNKNKTANAYAASKIAGQKFASKQAMRQSNRYGKRVAGKKAIVAGGLGAAAVAGLATRGGGDAVNKTANSIGNELRNSAKDRISELSHAGSVVGGNIGRLGKVAYDKVDVNKAVYGAGNALKSGYNELTHGM